jgi:plastocyanin
VHRALFAAALLLAATRAEATNWFVEVGGGAGLVFTPQQLEIAAGDTVTFVNRGGFHNVVADDGAFRCARGCDEDGKGGDGDSSSSLWRATVSFPDAGEFGYFCEAHGAPGEGMFGTIVVRAPPPPPIDVPVGPAWPYLALGLGLVLLALLDGRRRRRALRP